MKKEFVMKKRIVMWLSCVVLLMSGVAAMAQTITGAIRGTVTDPSGAVVSGATVTATNVETGVATTTTSNRTGLYNFQFLSVGNYTITATAKGFSTVSVGPFSLSIDQTAKIDTKLQVGKSATTVKVAADTAPLLNTEDATVNTTISSNTLKNMPLNGQNVQFATLFVPGAIDPTASFMSSSLGTERDAGGSVAAAIPSFSGNRQQGNDYILDGIEMNEPIQDSPAYNEAPFAVQEINVITGDAGAQYGNAAGSDIVMLTKAGTNKFHGNAWEYFQNQSMAANTWQNDFFKTKKAKFTQNQFGADVGGPIFKNKLFFFGDYSGMHYNTPTSQGFASVPDAKMSGNAPTGACPAGNSDLSEVLANEGIQLDNNSSGTASATAYPNNCIPIVNPVAAYLFSHPAALPGPNPPPGYTAPAGTVTAGNYIGTIASFNANNQGDVRVDYTVGSKDTLMGKYTYGYAYDQQTQDVLPVFFPLGDNYPFQSAMLQWVHTFSPSLVNNARGGFSKINQNIGIATDPSGLFGTHGDQTVGFGQAPGGIPYLTKGQLAVGFANMRMGGCSVADDVSCPGTSTAANGNIADNIFDYADDLTWEHGNHVTRAGVEALRYQENFYEVSNQGGPLGFFAYNGEFSQGTGAAYPFADFILDDGVNSKVAGNATPFAQRQWRDAVYVQDDWKARSNLTVNVGVRLIYDQPMYEAHNRMASANLAMANFAPASLNNSSVCGGAPNVAASCYPAWFEFAGQNGNSRALYNNVTAWNDFMPRLGFDWQVNHRTVIRGGYGITDDMEGMGYGLRMTQNAPFLASFAGTGGAPTATTGGTPLSAGLGYASAVSKGSTGIFTPGCGDFFSVWSPQLRPAMIQQFNLTAQVLINDQTSIAVGYVGEVGQHLVDPVGVNQYTNLVPRPVNGACPNNAPLGPNGGCTYTVDPYYTLEGPGCNNLIETQSEAIENYNALQVVVQHQQSNGLEYQVNYAYSKSMTDNPGYFGMNGTSGADPCGSFPQNGYDLMGDYGPSSGDARHILSATAVYQIPFGHGKKYGANVPRWEDEVAGGWELSGDAMLNSGFPITISSNPSSRINAFQMDCGVERANQYIPLKISHQSTTNWFGNDPSATPCRVVGQTTNVLGSPCAYGQPGGPTLADQFGSDHVGTERAPGFKQIDLSLFKAFRTVKDQDVKVRFDAFNAFNFASYGTPNADISSSSFGLIHNTLSPPRQLQLSAVYDF